MVASKWKCSSGEAEARYLAVSAFGSISIAASFIVCSRPPIENLVGGGGGGNQRVKTRRRSRRAKLTSAGEMTRLSALSALAE